MSIDRDRDIENLRREVERLRRRNGDCAGSARHRRAIKWSLIAALTVAPVVAFGVPTTMPAQSGPIQASDFDEIYAAVNALENNPVRVAGSKRISLNAIHCGVTSTTFTGALGGYPGAKAACESRCGSSSAHMCTPDEMVRTAQLGATMPSAEGWIAGGVNTSGSATQSDCGGFTLATAGLDGLTFTGTAPGRVDCSASLPILCCD